MVWFVETRTRFRSIYHFVIFFQPACIGISISQIFASRRPRFKIGNPAFFPRIQHILHTDILIPIFFTSHLSQRVLTFVHTRSEVLFANGRIRAPSNFQGFPPTPVFVCFLISRPARIFSKFLLVSNGIRQKSDAHFMNISVYFFDKFFRFPLSKSQENCDPNLYSPLLPKNLCNLIRRKL